MTMREVKRRGCYAAIEYLEQPVAVEQAGRRHGLTLPGNAAEEPKPPEAEFRMGIA